jgi:aryl-alcohol dehydrogenase-like predicted oxidoreductase
MVPTISLLALVLTATTTATTAVAPLCTRLPNTHLQNSVQNTYNLLQRNKFELGLIEVCSPKNCNVGMIANTALAGGALSGKYLGQTILEMDMDLRYYVLPSYANNE